MTSLVEHNRIKIFVAYKLYVVTFAFLGLDRLVYEATKKGLLRKIKLVMFEIIKSVPSIEVTKKCYQ